MSAATWEGDDADRARALRWYDRAKRDLPWRRDPSPYRTLVSEFMLQQTVVATVEPYFARFIARFPDVAPLAAASDDDGDGAVVGAWLLRACPKPAPCGGGDRRRSRRRDPGVGGGAARAARASGPYTAAAVAAIAFDARAFALDGNTMRVLARLTGDRRPVDVPATRGGPARARPREVPRRRAGDFNQALMELGALVCTPRSPRCEICPLAAACRARAEGRAASLPRKRPRAARPSRARRVRLQSRTARACWWCKRPRGLLAGTWALPEACGSRRAHAPGGGAAAGRGAGGASPGVSYRGAVRHVFTHRDVTAELFRVEVAASGPVAAANRRWIAPGGLAALGVSSFARKTVALGVGR
jgi:A/G-specific adenine glycosylase